MRNPVVLGLVAILVAIIVWFGLPKARNVLESFAGMVRHLFGGWK